MTVLIYCILLESSKIRSILNNSETSSSQRCYSGSSSSIQNVDKKSPSPIVDMKVPLYSNIKYSFAQNHSPMLPLDQYIREQAVLSGMVCIHFTRQFYTEKIITLMLYVIFPKLTIRQLKIDIFSRYY